MKNYLKKLYNKDKESYYKLLAKDLEKENKRFIITVNPETLMISEKDTEIKTMLDDNRASLVPDGIAVVKAARHIGYNIKERITGIEIMEYLLKEADNKHYSIYLFGATDIVINSLVSKLTQEHPSINILGYQNGYVKNKDNIMQEIVKLNPDIVILAMGIPLQEKLIYKYYNQFKKGILIGVGGSFDVISGNKKRAPKLFIKLNLEWFYRIITEPKRLKRFYQNNIKFLFKVKK